MAKAPSELLEFPDGTIVEAVFTKDRLFAVHRPLGSPKKDYVITYVPDLTCVLRCRLKTEATPIARALEFLWDRIGRDKLEWLVEELRT